MATIRTRRLHLPASLLGSAVLLTGCISDDSKPMNIFTPEGEQARKINDLHPWVFGIAGIVFVLVTGAVFWLVIKNRVNGDELDPEDLPAQTHGNTRLEVGWTVLPAVVLAILAVPTVVTVWALEEREADALPVMVVGQQWWWEYRYDVDGDGFFEGAEPPEPGVGADGAETEVVSGDAQHGSTRFDPDDLVVANELVIPADRQIDLTITSRDIIHSFWIPRLNGKRDAVPGRYHDWTIKADAPGKFVGWCTEFCGLSHARMRISAIALPQDEWDQWYENQLEPAETPTDEAAAAGQETFVAQCATCHVVNNDDIEYADDFLASQVSGAAPNLTHFATRSSFAGAIYGVYRGIDPNSNDFDVTGYLGLAETGGMDEAQLKAWISNAPGEKDMAPPDRGMPAFPALTEDELDNLVAYLATLD